MAKGKASVSSSGAAMSKYDVEVEKRLKALEAQSHPDRACTDGGDATLEERVSIIEAVLRKVDVVAFEKLAAKERAERG
tara:strand:- start:340 stop:576 length:237 start_codon:yes stop_codon:yes gene_type:complete